MEQVMRITTCRSSVDKPHLFCPVEEGSNPGGDRDPPNVPNTPFIRERERKRERERERERERVCVWDAVGEERRGERERVGRNGKGTERRRAKERSGERAGEAGERERGREWERDPQSKSRGLTGAKGGWWVRADQGVWDAMAARSSLMVKQRDAIAPLEHRRDTSLRVEKPKQDTG